MTTRTLVHALLLGIFPLFVYAADADSNAIRHWRAGSSISLASAQACDKTICFSAVPIDNAIFSRIAGRSYKVDCSVPLKELRYLKILHKNAKGEILLGELIVNNAIASDVLAIFKTLFQISYPIEKMLLIDDFDADDIASMTANNTSAFNFRKIAGSKKLSNHSLGLAIDINPLYNPYVKQSKSTLIVSPAAARPWVERNRTNPYLITQKSAVYKIFRQYGFEWGGNWTSLKDWQHFEKNPASTR